MALFGIDIYDGTQPDVELHFRNASGATFPMLLKGSKTGSAYKASVHYVVVVDHEGVVQYHKKGVQGKQDQVRQALDAALKAAVKPAQEAAVQTGVEATTWSEVKKSAE